MIGVTSSDTATPYFTWRLMKLGWKKKTAPEAKGLGLGPAECSESAAAPRPSANWLSQCAPDYRPPTNSGPHYL